MRNIKGITFSHSIENDRIRFILGGKVDGDDKTYTTDVLVSAITPPEVANKIMFDLLSSLLNLVNSTSHKYTTVQHEASENVFYVYNYVSKPMVMITIKTWKHF